MGRNLRKSGQVPYVAFYNWWAKDLRFVISQKVKLRSPGHPKVNSLANTARKLCIVSVVCGIWLKLYMHVTPCSSLTLICVGCIESPWKNNSTFDHKAWQRWDTSLQPRSCHHTNTIKPTRNRKPLRGWLQSSLVLPTKNLQQGRDIHKPCMIWSLIPELWEKSSSPPSEGHNLFLKRSRNSSGYCNSWSVSSN